MSEKKNWRPMVEVGRDWAGNSLVFATKEEAEANALADVALDIGDRHSCRSNR